MRERPDGRRQCFSSIIVEIDINRKYIPKLSQYLSKGDVPNIFLRTVATNGAFDLPDFFSFECADVGDDLDVLLLLASC